MALESLRSFTFSSADVDSYVDAIRSAGARTLEAAFSTAGRELPLPVAELSLPFLSHVYYARKQLPDVAWLAAKMAQDVRRSTFRCGSCVIATDDLEGDARAEALYHQAQALVAKAWPAMAQLATVLCRRVSHVPAGEKYESSSDPKALGQIYFNMKRTTPMGWAEVLSHETAHQYLFVTSAKPAVFQGIDWNQRTFSSIKGEERPLIALFHGATAECAMLSLALLALERAPEVEAESQALLGRYREGFFRDYEALQSFGVVGRDATIDRFYAACAEALSSA
jgi:hypothetical protein